MSRLLEFEVFSPVCLVSPETFFADVESVGFDVLGKEYQQQIRYSGGETTSPRESGLHVVPPNKLKYYYLSRVAPHLGYNSLQLAEAASMVIKDRRFPDAIGGDDMIDPMVEASGVDEDEKFCEEFDYIDKIKSRRYPGQIVLALKQLPGVYRLGSMVDIANEILDGQRIELFEDVEAKKLMNTHEIQGCIPFARVKREDIPEKKINQAIKDLTENSLVNNVKVVIGPIKHAISET